MRCDIPTETQRNAFIVLTLILLMFLGYATNKYSRQVERTNQVWNMYLEYRAAVEGTFEK